jgi:hypothetical protein
MRVPGASVIVGGTYLGQVYLVGVLVCGWWFPLSVIGHWFGHLAVVDRSPFMGWLLPQVMPGTGRCSAVLARNRIGIKVH